jgi:hypothetical protein
VYCAWWKCKYNCIGREGGETCIVHVENEDTNNKGGLEMYGIIILKLILEKQNTHVWVGFT